MNIFQCNVFTVAVIILELLQGLNFISVSDVVTYEIKHRDNLKIISK